MTTLVLTDAGRAALVNSSNTGTNAVNVTRIGIGTGYQQPLGAVTEMVAQVAILDSVGAINADPGVIAGGAFFTNSSGGDWTIKEIGVYAQIGGGAEFLFAYEASETGISLIPNTASRPVDYVIAFLNSTTPAADVNVTLSPSFTMNVTIGDEGASAFIDLSDTPAVFVAGKFVRVNDAGDALVFDDVPSAVHQQHISFNAVALAGSHTGAVTHLSHSLRALLAAGRIVEVSVSARVKYQSGQTSPTGNVGLHIYPGASGTGGQISADVVEKPSALTGALQNAHWTFRLTAGTNSFRLHWTGGSFVIAVEDIEMTIHEGVVTEFADLNDTPATLAGQGGKFVAVNSAGNALSLVNAPAGGGGALTDGSVQTRHIAPLAVTGDKIGASIDSLQEKYGTPSGGTPGTPAHYTFHDSVIAAVGLPHQTETNNAVSGSSISIANSPTPVTRNSDGTLQWVDDDTTIQYVQFTGLAALEVGETVEVYQPATRGADITHPYILSLPYSTSDTTPNGWGFTTGKVYWYDSGASLVRSLLSGSGFTSTNFQRQLHYLTRIHRLPDSGGNPQFRIGVYLADEDGNEILNHETIPNFSHLDLPQLISDNWVIRLGFSGNINGNGDSSLAWDGEMNSIILRRFSHVESWSHFIARRGSDYYTFNPAVPAVRGNHLITGENFGDELARTITAKTKRDDIIAMFGFEFQGAVENAISDGAAMTVVGHVGRDEETGELVFAEDDFSTQRTEFEMAALADGDSIYILLDVKSQGDNTRHGRIWSVNYLSADYALLRSDLHLRLQHGSGHTDITTLTAEQWAGKLCIYTKLKRNGANIVLGLHITDETGAVIYSNAAANTQAIVALTADFTLHVAGADFSDPNVPHRSWDGRIGRGVILRPDTEISFAETKLLNRNSFWGLYYNGVELGIGDSYLRGFSITPELRTADGGSGLPSNAYRDTGVVFSATGDKVIRRLVNNFDGRTIGKFLQGGISDLTLEGSVHGWIQDTVHFHAELIFKLIDRQTGAQIGNDISIHEEEIRVVGRSGFSYKLQELNGVRVFGANNPINFEEQNVTIELHMHLSTDSDETARTSGTLTRLYFKQPQLNMWSAPPARY